MTTLSSSASVVSGVPFRRPRGDEGALVVALLRARQREDLGDLLPEDEPPQVEVVDGDVRVKLP